MPLTRSHAKFELDSESRILLRDVVGRTVTCTRGHVWITMERDIRDIVLGAGNSFIVDRAGLTIVAANETSTIALSAQVARPGWLSRSMGFLDRVWGPAAVRKPRSGEYF